MKITNFFQKITLNNINRAWKIYVMQPKEAKVYLDYHLIPILTKKVFSVATALDPKQVAANLNEKTVFVSCMKGRVLQSFSYANNYLSKICEWNFEEQCVEVEIVDKICFVTTTNFKRGPDQSSHLFAIDICTGSILSSVDTKGEWSKVIKIDKKRNIAFVSNWRSSNLSIIDISDLNNMKVIQLLSCQESPRGLVVGPSGVVVATSFFGRNIFTIEKDKDGRYFIMNESAPFDSGNYGGNMRDILINKAGSLVWVSNLGRNMIHCYNVQNLEINYSILVPRQPNSMRFLDEAENIIIVSSRKDRLVCFVDLQKKTVFGISEKTGNLPTGLTTIDDGFIVTNFKDNTIELHHMKTATVQE